MEVRTKINKHQEIVFRSPEDALLFWANFAQIEAFKPLYEKIGSDLPVSETYNALRTSENAERLADVIKNTQVYSIGRPGKLPLAKVLKGKLSP